MAVIDVRDKVVQIVRSRGPLLPVQITKEIKTNVLFASAMLSELVDKKILKLSNTKIGGSPVYYVVGQEPKLQSLRDKLNDKQQKAFDMLKQKTILRDADQEPVIRQSLRDIKDFAHPLHVQHGQTAEIFWKWYLTSNAEAEILVKERLGLLEKKKETETEEVQKHLSEIEKDLQKLEENKKKEEVKTLAQHAKEREMTPKVEKSAPKKVDSPKNESPNPQPAEEAQTSLKEEPHIDETDTFVKLVLQYFRHNDIEVSGLKQIRKNTDWECEVKIPSAVGNIAYFCKAKNKKRISDADLSLLFVQSQMRKMPVLLLTTGDISKKGKELLTKEFKNITIKQL